MDDMQFGERLRSIRTERNLTQIELAADLDVSAGRVADWERGARDVRLATVRRLAAALQVDTAELVRDE